MKDPIGALACADRNMRSLFAFFESRFAFALEALLALRIAAQTSNVCGVLSRLCGRRSIQLISELQYLQMLMCMLDVLDV